MTDIVSKYMGKLRDKYIFLLTNKYVTIVGKVKNGRVFAVCGQTNGFSQFKVDSICLPMFPHCGSFTIRRVDHHHMPSSVVLT